MTNREAIDILLKMMPKPRRGDDSQSMTHTKMAIALTMGIMALRRYINGWIPVTERLPKPGELDGDVDKYYLVQHESGDMTVARYAHSEHWGNYWEQIFTGRPIAGEIVAWMPLPEEYQVESEVEE